MGPRVWELVLALVCLALSIASFVLAEAQPWNMSDQTGLWMLVASIGFLTAPVGIFVGWRAGKVAAFVFSSSKK